MSYAAIFDEDGWEDTSRGGDIASSYGYHLLCEWVYVHGKDLPQLLAMCEKGQSLDLSQLKRDVKTAIWRCVGTRKNTVSNRSVLKGLLKMLKNRGDAEFVTISDGC